VDQGVISAPTRPARLMLGSFFLAYLAGTVLLFYFGPWMYALGPHQGTLLLFLGAVHAAFAGGYLLGIRGAPRASAVSMPVATLVVICVAVDLLLLFPTSKLNTGAWIPNPFAALRDLGDAYDLSLKLRDSSTPYVNYVRILVSPLLAAATPLAVFYWSQLGWTTRILFVASVIGTLALFVAMGANAGIAHWMMLFPWFVIAGHLAGIQRISRRTWMAVGALQAATVVAFVVFFGATMVQRTGSFASAGLIESIAARTRTGGPDEAARKNRSATRIAAEGLASYLTQGYFAVYLSLQEPFVPTYGVGNSVFLLRQAARLTGDASLLERPYPERLKKYGWNAYGLWATIYPWIASDVTFPGTVVVVFLVGVVLGLVWVDVLGGRNPFAVAFLGQMLIVLYYFPAHNKAMQTGEGVVALWVLGALWLISRRRRVASPAGAM
jgi:hypothetical protein